KDKNLYRLPMDKNIVRLPIILHTTKSCDAYHEQSHVISIRCSKKTVETYVKNLILESVNLKRSTVFLLYKGKQDKLRMKRGNCRGTRTCTDYLIEQDNTGYTCI
ncbi:hypothetical protein CA599_31530, partial [Paenibacillus taichungensis]